MLLARLALIRAYYHIHINLLMPIKHLLALNMLQSSNQTLVVSEMNCLLDDSIPSREPPFKKEVYFVLQPRFLSRTFLYVHSRNMFSCLVLNYGSTSTTPPCLTQYSRVKLTISRSLSASSARALPRPSSNIE